MIQIPELGIDGISVEDVDDFNEAAGEELTLFCEDLQEKGMYRPITEDDSVGDDWAFIWSDEASKLIHAEIDRLYSIGRKYFGDTLDLDISSYMFKEE